MTPLAYSIPQAAEALSLSESHTRRLVRRGELPTVRLGQRIVVPHTALVRFLDAAVASRSSVVPTTPPATGERLGATESSADTDFGTGTRRSAATSVASVAPTPHTDDAPDHAGKRAVGGVS